jgi:hypothetical protein
MAQYDITGIAARHARQELKSGQSVSGVDEVSLTS